MSDTRDHGGRLDLAISQYGGNRNTWLDLSTGINPASYPVNGISGSAWQDLPDNAANDALLDAARRFWSVPDTAAILAAPGASSLIANIPRLTARGRVRIDTTTYNEHAAAFKTAGWDVTQDTAPNRVVVHPNNPTGAFWCPTTDHNLEIIDESFCDVAPAQSLIARASRTGTLILKSFGKFWGLAGLRLGFAIGDPALIAKLRDMLGPWPVSGPALTLGAIALQDLQWAQNTRETLQQQSQKLDALMTSAGATIVGGTSLFRLYDTPNASQWQSHLATRHIWSRTFPYSQSWLRLGLPDPHRWEHLESALDGMAGGAMAQPSAQPTAT